MKVSHNCFVLFTKNFKYLIAYLTHNLTDDMEISTRTKKAKNMLASLGNVLNHPDVDINLKRIILSTRVFSILLFGCETWSLTHKLKEEILSTFHQCLHTALGVNMFHIKTYSISNENVRNAMNINHPMEIV